MATPDRPVPPRRGLLRARNRWLKFEWLDERRVLASITGQVFQDLNNSLRKNDSEPGLENRVVYVDLDQDGLVDAGEPIKQTDAEGRFSFDDLALGDYSVRLFNGTTSQFQVSPFRGERIPGLIPVTDPFSAGTASHLQSAGDLGLISYTASGRILTQVDLAAGTSRSLEMPGVITDYNPLGGDSVLVTLARAGLNPNQATPDGVLVSFADSQVTPLDLSNSSDVFFGALAIGRDQEGLLVPQGIPGASVPLHTLAFDSVAASWTTTPLALQVDASAQVFASANSPVILVSQPAGNNLQLALWSSVTDSVIVDSESIVSGIASILAFDADTNMAIARTKSGGVSVLDAGNGFSTLHVLADWDGPIAFDPHRELLFGVLDDAALGVFDLREGKNLFFLSLNASAGAVAGLALADGGNRIALRSAAGVSQVRIDRPEAHRVALRADASTKDILFGMYVEGTNDSPNFGNLPDYSILEDHTLNIPAPGLAATVVDPQDDDFIILPVTQASHGIAEVRPDGSFTYRPNANFFGVDSFQVLATDGRDPSDVMTVEVTVLPVNDRASGIEVIIPSFPEDIRGPVSIGTIRVNDVEGDDYLIWISDPRFELEGIHIMVVEGVIFDHESEPSISVTITATNPEDSSDSIAYATQLLVEDADDAPTEILPRTATVEEGIAGALIAQLSLVDQDSTAGYTFTVADTRFVIDGSTLRLAPSVALDHEATPSIDVQVVVHGPENETLLSQAITVQVGNTNDLITDILLSGTTLPELASGYRVGSVTVVDQDAGATHDLQVDDSRFEIVERQLRLRNGVYVRRSDQAEILINITAIETNAGSSSFSKEFVLTVLENESPWHNPLNPTDVDGSGQTTPLDALIIINTLNQQGPRDLDDPIPHETGSPRLIDVNGDGRVTPLDALIIINILNRSGTGSAEPGGNPPTTSGEGEGPSLPLNPAPTSPWNSEDDEDEDRGLVLEDLVQSPKSFR